MGYLLYFSAETWTLLAALVTLILVYGSWSYGVFKQMGVPGPKPLLFLGTWMEYRKALVNFDYECFKKYGKIWGIFDGRQPVLCVTDPAMIKSILVKEGYLLFTNRRNFHVNGGMYDAVNFAEDEHWKRIRSVLSPFFTTGKLKEMFDIIKQNSAKLITSMQKTADKDESLDLKEFFGSFSMDGIMSTGFSVDIGSLDNPSDPFVSNVRELARFDFFSPLFLFQVFFPFIIPLYDKMELAYFPSSVTDFYYTVLQKIKNDRKSSKQANRVDSLQLMMDSQKNSTVEKNKGLSDHELLSQGLFMIFAAYETNSSSLTFLAYILARNPHVMKKLQEEIDSTFPNKAPVEYQALMQMEYLDSVINESLRLYPIVLRVERVTKATVEINGLEIPKGMVITVPTWTLHHDPDSWPEPEEFIPERFSKENKQNIDPYTYLPFGEGPRKCIGMRFALMSMKLVAVEILQRFSFSVCEETEIPLEMDNQILLMPKQPIKLKLEKRS
ncbi:cytochrome P450 3A56-like [Solea solea]|uniref:cytochrome P450 3A56-like n=1 Tax=Solea solea TaxID=90069 RepID=UPI00272D8FC2|nr:cytochrome P450 3A56-like [Solea solea]